MERTKEFLRQHGLPDRDAYDLPTSVKRFPDGAQYRVEIPSVEGPACLRAVFDACDQYGIRIDRVSQGSGIMLLTDEEIRDMGRMAAERRVELSLFVGPRGTYDISAQPFTRAGKGMALRVEGMDQVIYSIEDIKRACALGIRGVLVADEGVLWLIRELKKAGELPADLIVKASVQMGHGNPISIRWMEELGVGTYNVPTALTLPKLAAIRQAVDVPLDIYVEVPDDFGGFIRHYELPEIIRVAAPVYIKFGLRNAPNIYPSGTHLEATAVALTTERVRRAKLGLDLMSRYAPQCIRSEAGASGLAIPLMEGLEKQ